MLDGLLQAALRAVGHQALLEGDALKDRAVDVRLAVSPRKAQEDTARVEVPVWRERVVPVRHGEQSARAGGELCRGRLQDLLRREAEAELARVEAGEPVHEPAHRVGAGRQQGLQGVRSRDRPGEHPVLVPVRVVLAVGPRDDGRAEVEVGPARLGDVRAQAGRLAVADAADYGKTGGQPDLARHVLFELPDHVPRRVQLAHLLAAQAHGLEKVVGPVEALHVHEPQGVGGRPRGAPVAGHAVHEEGVHVNDLGRLVQRPWLVLAQPEHLVEAGRRVGRLARDAVHLLGAVPRDLVLRARVQPQYGRPDRMVVLVEANEGLALVRDADGPDAPRVHDLRRTPQRDLRRLPPVLGVLLAKVRLRA